jgi:hypothetical protein
MARELMGCMWAMAKQVPLTPSSHNIEGECTKSAEGFRRPFEAAQPRGGASLDGVKRLTYTLVPRPRPAPDGRQSGGPNPRIAAGSTVASDWRRLFPCPREKTHHGDLKQLYSTLDIGSHINAQHVPIRPGHGAPASWRSGPTPATLPHGHPRTAGPAISARGRPQAGGTAANTPDGRALAPAPPPR